jgi:predicted DNA binding protein
LIEALLSLRVPGLWVTPVSEKYDLEITCRVGGRKRGEGWGLVTLKGKDSVIDEALALICDHPSVGGVDVISRGDRSVNIVVDVVYCPACEVLITSRSFLVFPVEIYKGWMKWLLITDNETLGGVIDGLGELGIENRVDRLTSLGEKGVLTDRQEEVIRKAFSLGYFDFPRGKDSIEVAKEVGVSISTLSEILRAAERRIFSEYLRA